MSTTQFSVVIVVMNDMYDCNSDRRTSYTILQTDIRRRICTIEVYMQANSDKRRRNKWDNGRDGTSRVEI